MQLICEYNNDNNNAHNSKGKIRVHWRFARCFSFPSKASERESDTRAELIALSHTLAHTPYCVHCLYLASSLRLLACLCLCFVILYKLLHLRFCYFLWANAASAIHFGIRFIRALFKVPIWILFYIWFRATNASVANIFIRMSAVLMVI